MNDCDNFTRRYPYGILTEQEGGLPDDVENWWGATHVCRKHRALERVCEDAVSDDQVEAFNRAFAAPLTEEEA